MEVTADFRRYYRLTVPTDTDGMPGTVLHRLTRGLERMDGSLLRETLLDTMPPAPGGQGATSMTWHGWDPKTMLLLNLNNLLSAFLGAPAIGPPGHTGDGTAAQEGTGTGQEGGHQQTAQEFIDNIRQLFGGHAVNGA